MDLSLGPEDQTFREDVRAFVEANLPADIRHKVEEGLGASKEDMLRWNEILYRKGWVASA